MLKPNNQSDSYFVFLSFRMLNNINKPAFFVLVLYPILLVSLLANYILDHGASFGEIALMISTYYMYNISVGIGLHRLWSHNAYKTNKYVEFVLAVISAGTLQGSALSWASNHFKHHTYTDKEQDPHSPLKYDNKILGFIWSHIGWMLTGEGSYKSIDRVTMVKLGRNKVLKWQMQNYWQLAVFMNLFVPVLVGYLMGGTLLSIYSAFLFMGCGRALQQQITFCVNSLCHFAGSKKYYKGTAGDIWWFALFLLGENWHNYHHAFPSDYRNGIKWYHFDVHKWVIYWMSKVGLAWDLDRVSQVRIQAKVEEVRSHLAEKHKHKLCVMQNKIEELLENLRLKIKEVEESSISITEHLKKSFTETHESLRLLAEQLSNSLQKAEKPSEKLIKIISKKIRNAEEAVCVLYNQLNSTRISD